VFLPKYVKRAIALLEQNGYEAYIVGGCVRNRLLCRRVYDYDITTSALPDEIKSVFKNYKTIDTGILHGTVTVIISGKPLEITTYRQDGSYKDSRHPNSVTFLKDLEGDLSRRDFTVNSLAYNQKSGVIDLFSGQKDLEDRILRTVGRPAERFNEDALRILRGLRFCAQYNLAAEENTKKAMLESYCLLSNVSKERILKELKGIVCSDNTARIICDYAEIFSFIMPELVFDKRAVSALKKLPKSFPLRFCALFSPLDNTAAEATLKELKSDSKTIETVSLLLKNLHAPTNSKPQIKRLLSRLSPNLFSDLLKLKKALFSQDIYPATCLFNEITKNSECFSLCTLAVSGDDLLSLGFKGKEIGAILKSLLNEVINDRLPNNFDALIKYAKEQR